MPKTIDLDTLTKTAEEFYRRGDYYCSESIVRTIRDAFGLQIDDSIVAGASGFPVGMGGAGCSCGAISGGIIALGMVYGRTKPKDKRVNHAMALSKELHDNFRANHKTLCCRVHTKGLKLGSRKHMKQCVAFTGEVAREVAEIIIRESQGKYIATGGQHAK
jgi:C_GCAxxG_C_C family probable redox protein